MIFVGAILGGPELHHSETLMESPGLRRFLLDSIRAAIHLAKPKFAKAGRPRGQPGASMRIVRVPGQDVKYPDACACCATKSTTTLEIRKEDLKALALALSSAAVRTAAGKSTGGAGLLRDSRAVRVPYCKMCSGHVRWKRSGGWLGVALHVPVTAFFGLVLGFFVATLAGAAGIGGAEFDLDHPNWFIVGAFVAGGVAFGLMTMRWRPRGPLSRQHAAEGDALQIARFTSSEIILRCHSDQFADKLRQANPGSAFSVVA